VEAATPTVEVTVNGKPVRALIDSGAQYSVIDQSLVETLGLTNVRVELHPEVHLPLTVNVARSPEEAEKQARGEDVRAEQQAEDESLEAELAAELSELGAASED
jgi:large subunit ribosomal protein L9